MDTDLCAPKDHVNHNYYALIVNAPENPFQGKRSGGHPSVPANGRHHHGRVSMLSSSLANVCRLLGLSVSRGVCVTRTVQGV